MHTPAPQDQIHNLSMEFMNPLGAERAMRKSLKSKLTIQEKILLKDQMMCLKEIGTDEIQNVACKVSKKIKYDKNIVMDRIIKFIMKLKIGDILKDIEEEKYNSERYREQLDVIVRPKTIAAREYRKYVKYKLEAKWKDQKEIIRNRVKHLEGKH